MKVDSKKTKKIAKIVFMLLVIFFVGGFGGVYFDQHVLPFIRTNKFLSRFDFLKRSAENVTVINKTEQVVIKEDDSINEIAAHASNSVVNIISLSSLNSSEAFSKTIKPQDQSGTGIIVTGDGLIATYRSAIIEKNATYQVLLFNGSSYEAKLVGIDEFSNLAFLKIEASNLTAISFGDSSGVRPGKKVVAIGNSSGEYQNRYAVGLLSNIAKAYNLGGKTVSVSEKLEGVFENDFANPEEYVGGPVIGYSGDMLGLVGTVIIDGKNEYFQIPSSVVQRSLQDALGEGFAGRPFFGTYYVSITKEYAIAHNLKRDQGAMIFSPSGKQGLAVISASPAEKAGIQINDIIVSVNDQIINLDNPFSNIISQYKKGDTVKLLIDRGGKEISIQAKL